VVLINFQPPCVDDFGIKKSWNLEAMQKIQIFAMKQFDVT